MKRRNQRAYTNYNKRKKVLIAVTIVLLLLIGGTVIFSGFNNSNVSKSYLSAGVCGAINRPGVYRLPVNASLAELIVLGNGISDNADIRNIDIEKILKNDSIYHIPFRKDKKERISAEVIDRLPAVKTNKKAEECINFFYVGYPAMYFLINYNTKTNKTLVTYIPHSSLFLDNEYRLIDIYFTLGRDYAIDLLQKSLGIKIDYYFVQDRSSFISMVDQLSGLEIDVDKWYAEEYHMKPGKQVLDGFHTFEFIRYIQKKTKRTILKGNNLELAYNLRQSRMKQTLSALFGNFKKSSVKQKVSTLAAIMHSNNTDTNIDISAVTRLVSKIIDNPYLDFETIHGYYKKKNNNLYYIPTEWNFKKLRKQQELDAFQVIKGKHEQILY